MTCQPLQAGSFLVCREALTAPVYVEVGIGHHVVIPHAQGNAHKKVVKPSGCQQHLQHLAGDACVTSSGVHTQNDIKSPEVAVVQLTY